MVKKISEPIKVKFCNDLTLAFRKLCTSSISYHPFSSIHFLDIKKTKQKTRLLAHEARIRQDQNSRGLKEGRWPQHEGVGKNENPDLWPRRYGTWSAENEPRDPASAWVGARPGGKLARNKFYRPAQSISARPPSCCRRRHFGDHALTSLNENVREKKAALAVKHAWCQHVLTIVSERPAAFCFHAFGR